MKTYAGEWTEFAMNYPLLDNTADKINNKLIEVLNKQSLELKR